jgi:serine/threonine-protein kinase
MSRPAALETKRRALELFEHMLDLPPDARRSGKLFAGESVEVLMEIAALEAADARSSESFPTEFPASPAAQLAPRPSRVGPYRLEEMIGEGGMGEVWRGVRDDGLFDLSVAVKLIRPEIFSPAAELRFAHERRLLARLDHPGIARIIDGGIADGWPYLVTELVPGQAIDRYCAERDATLRERVTLIRDAALALKTAHAQLVAHCDIKPVNLLVEAGGRTRLVDFGIARLLDEEAEATGQAQPMTPAYASPERKEGALPGPSDDVYALGIVLRDLAAELTPDEGVGAIVGCATAPTAAERYPTMDAMAADFDNWLSDRPVEARGPNLRYRMRCFARRHRFGMAASAVAVAALLVAVAVGIAGYVRTERARAAEAERVEDLREVSHYLLFDLQRELARQPNSLALRTRIAERLQTYLDRMAADRGASPLIRTEAAEGLVLLADQQANPGQANLGQPEQARRNLDRAAALMAGLPGNRAALLRARIGMNLARLLENYDQDLALADAKLAAAGKELAAAGKRGAALRGEWLTERATLRGWQNRFPESVADARAATREKLPADPLEAALLSARTADILAESIFYGGDHEGAIEPYRRQLAILGEALKQWPGERRVRRNYARATWALGTTLIDLDRYREALPLLEEGREVVGALVAEDRDDKDAERVANIQEVAYAQALSGVGRASEAIAVMSATVEHRRQAWLATPDEARRMRDYTIAIAALGDMLAENGRTAQACSTYATADAMFETMKKRGKLIDADRVYSYRLLAEARAHYCS